MSGKRLFWISIIILELVLVYVAWKPVRGRFRPASHPVAHAPAVRRPEMKTSPVVIGPLQPLKAARSHVPTRRPQLIVNAGLKEPEPIPANAAAKLTSAPVESFWCHLSKVESKCDCKAIGDESASNLVVP